MSRNVRTVVTPFAMDRCRFVVIRYCSLQFAEYLTVSLLQKPFPLQFISHSYGEERCRTIILDPQRKGRPTNCSWSCQYVDIRCAFFVHLLHLFWFVLHYCTSPATLIYMSLCVGCNSFLSIRIEIIPLHSPLNCCDSYQFVSQMSSVGSSYIFHDHPWRNLSRQDHGNPL